MDTKLTSILNTDVLSETRESVREKPKNYLMFSRSVDFLMMGGFGIALWVPLYFYGGMLSKSASLGVILPTLAMYLAIIVNHPHFMASYKLAYTQGRDFVTRNYFQLLLVPLLL